MFDKIDISDIVRDHLGTLRNNATKRYRPWDFVLFFGGPSFVATVLVLIYGDFPANLIGVAATSLSVFTALLLNLLLLAYNITRNSKAPADPHIRNTREELFHEIFSNIAFAVLVASMAVVSVFIFGIVQECEQPIVTKSLSLVVYSMGALFLLTLLMLLKRVYVLLKNEQVTPEIDDSGRTRTCT